MGGGGSGSSRANSLRVDRPKGYLDQIVVGKVGVVIEVIVVMVETFKPIHVQKIQGVLSCHH